MKYWITIIIALISPFFYSCNDDPGAPLYFIGDSIVARWDVEEYFPSFTTYNLGVSGAGIDYIESLSGTQKGHNAVIMIGTNNYWLYNSEASLKNYAVRYLDAIENLRAEHVYLYSVLPRDAESDPEDINDIIIRFNDYIQQLIAGNSNITYINVYHDFTYRNSTSIDPELYSDRLHLSSLGYEKLAAALLDVLH